jgi:type IV pilus assembly protein PilC
MADFVCKVGDASGRIFQQVETAQSEAEARQKLADRGYYVYTVRSQFNLLAQFSQSGRDRKIRSDDFLIFNQQFNTLVRAGLPILRALDLLAERAAAARLRPILEDVRQRVRTGALLSEAMAAQGSFPPVYITVIAAGERSGVTTGFRSRLITALIYPAVLVLVAIIVVSYLATYALPKFAELYQQLNVPLPATTRILLAIAVPLRDYFALFAVVVVASAFGIFLWTRSSRGAIAIDRLKPRIPLFGDIWIKAQIAQFVRTLSTLLAGGTPLVPALRTSAAAISSKLVATSVEQASERVREGQSLHLSLAETRLVPGLALEMIEVGEASGALTAMLTSVAEFYEEEVDTQLTRSLSWIPIVILVVMAVVVGFILISLYLPMFSLQVGSVGG